MEQDLPPSRRSVVRVGAAAALGIAGAGTLAACGGGDSPGTAATTAGPSPAASAAGTSPAATPSGTASGPSEAALAALEDVPVGQAVRVEGPSGTVIVAQPAAGSVVAFDARCPHQGCKVNVDNTTLACPCHGSRFELATGKVLNGPATEDLSPIAVRVQGTSIVPA